MIIHYGSPLSKRFGVWSCYRRDRVRGKRVLVKSAIQDSKHGDFTNGLNRKRVVWVPIWVQFSGNKVLV